MSNKSTASSVSTISSAISSATSPAVSVSSANVNTVINMNAQGDIWASRIKELDNFRKACKSSMALNVEGQRVVVLAIRRLVSTANDRYAMSKSLKGFDLEISFEELQGRGLLLIKELFASPAFPLFVRKRMRNFFKNEFGINSKGDGSLKNQVFKISQYREMQSKAENWIKEGNFPVLFECDKERSKGGDKPTELVTATSLVDKLIKKLETNVNIEGGALQGALLRATRENPVEFRFTFGNTKLIKFLIDNPDIVEELKTRMNQDLNGKVQELQEKYRKHG